MNVFEEKSAGDIEALINNGFAYAGLLAAHKAIQDVLYRLDETGTIGDMMQTYEAMTEFGYHDVVTECLPSTRLWSCGKAIQAFKKIRMVPAKWGPPSPPENAVPKPSD